MGRNTRIQPLSVARGRHGTVAIGTRRHRHILESLEAWTHGIDAGGRRVEEKVAVLIDGDPHEWRARGELAETRISAEVVGSARLRLRIASTFPRSFTLFGHSLYARFSVPATQAITPDGKLLALPQGQRWLERQGVVFGRGARAATVWRAPQVSSLHLDADRQALEIRLDHALDHPQIVRGPDGSHSPASASVVAAGDVLHNEFEIGIGFAPESLPRLLVPPAGRVATHVWTEHACFADFRLHRAVYFGHEDIERASEARGGFVFHGVPVTKSVFYRNDMLLDNGRQSAIFVGPMTAIENEPRMAPFLDELAARGHDIGLHCVQPGASPAAVLDEALEFMRERYRSATWIDHAWYAPEGLTDHTSPEATIVDGWVPHSPHYMVQRWHDNGVRYLWNAAFEQADDVWMPRSWFSPDPPPVRRDLQRRWREATAQAGEWLRRRYGILPPAPRPRPQRLNTRAGSGERPDPLWWRHPFLEAADVAGSRSLTARDARLVSWATRRIYRTAEHPRERHEIELRQLIQEWGTCVMHAYTPFIGEEHTAADAEGRRVIHEDFDARIAMLRKLDDDGYLWNATVRMWLDRIGALEQVRLFQDTASEVSVRNEGHDTIRGLCIAVRARTARCDTALLSTRSFGLDLLVSFDIEAGETHRIELAND